MQQTLNAIDRESMQKPASTAPGCKGRHIKDFHDLLASESTSVNVVEYEEDEDEEGCIKMIEARVKMAGGCQTVSGSKWKKKMTTRCIKSM